MTDRSAQLQSILDKLRLGILASIALALILHWPPGETWLVRYSIGLSFLLGCTHFIDFSTCRRDPLGSIRFVWRHISTTQRETMDQGFFIFCLKTIIGIFVSAMTILWLFQDESTAMGVYSCALILVIARMRLALWRTAKI